MVERILDDAGIADPAAREHYRRWLPLERRQGRYFAELVLAHLPRRVDALLRGRLRSALDFGCSCGHLVHLLSERYPELRAEGIDIERIRVAAARRAYPGLRFHLDEGQGIPGMYDAVFSSNVLEHFADPLRLLQDVLMPRAAHLVVSLVPYREVERIEGHLVSFDDGTFPERLGGFVLTDATPIDCTASGPECWPGWQLLAVYERDRRDP